MSRKHNEPPMTEREWRRRYIQMLMVDVGLLDPPDASGRMTKPMPKSAAARKRVVEALCAEAGLPQPQWGAGRAKGEPIDDAPWRAAREASVRAQHERLGRHGLALDTNRRALYCMACHEVLAHFRQGRVLAMGTTPALLAARHLAAGCR